MSFQHRHFTSLADNLFQKKVEFDEFAVAEHYSEMLASKISELGDLRLTDVIISYLAGRQQAFVTHQLPLVCTIKRAVLKRLHGLLE